MWLPLSEGEPNGSPRQQGTRQSGPWGPYRQASPPTGLFSFVGETSSSGPLVRRRRKRTAGHTHATPAAASASIIVVEDRSHPLRIRDRGIAGLAQVDEEPLG